MQIVVFRIGGEDYAFEIHKVQEIVRVVEITRLPNMPGYIEGVVNLRGKVIPVINLAKKFTLSSNSESYTTRLIVLNLQEDKKIAVKTEEVSEVLTIQEDLLDPVPVLVAKENQEHCLKGIIRLEERLIMLLDVDSILEADYIPVTNS